MCFSLFSAIIFAFCDPPPNNHTYEIIDYNTFAEEEDLTFSFWEEVTDNTRKLWQFTKHSHDMKLMMP